MGFLSKLSSVSLATLAIANAAEILPVSNQKDVIANSYVVVMKDDISSEAFDTHKQWLLSIHSGNSTRMEAGFTGTPKHTYTTLLKGYSGMFDDHAIQEISNDDNVCVSPANLLRSIKMQFTADNRKPRLPI